MLTQRVRWGSRTQSLPSSHCIIVLGDFICLLRNLSQAVCDRQFKSGINIVPINQFFLSEAELQIESPMTFIDLKNHPCMLNLFIEQGNRVQAHKAVDEIRCHHL